MATPIPLQIPPRNPKQELQSRLENAPQQHAEALLAAYETLQALHDKGAFDLLNGAINSSDKLLEIAVTAAKSPESTQGLRNLIILINTLGQIDPASLKLFAQAIPDALKTATTRLEPVGLWRLLKDFLWNKDFRHGLAAVNALLESYGKSLIAEKHPNIATDKKATE
jgi:uncharacterized protein YjgD (DUF1641 family)